MTIPLKSAAKKAYKDLKDNCEEISNLTYAQFLSRYSTWNGFKSYTDYQKQQNPPTPLSFEQRLANRVYQSKNIIFAKFGWGKSFLMMHLIVEMLSLGKKVRILDYGRSYLKFSELLQGKSVTTIENWHSEAPLGLWDCEHSPPEISTLKDKEVHYVVDEFWYIANKLGTLNIGEFLKEDKLTLISQSFRDFDDMPIVGNFAQLSAGAGSVKTSLWTYQIKERDEEFGVEVKKQISFCFDGRIVPQ